VAIGTGAVEACIEEWSGRRHGGLGRKGGILSARGHGRNRTQGDRPSPRGALIYCGGLRAHLVSSMAHR
jgi:hypothetical protein